MLKIQDITNAPPSWKEGLIVAIVYGIPFAFIYACIHTFIH